MRSATDFVGVRWVGKILSKYSETFEFELRVGNGGNNSTEWNTGGDGARMWIDDVVVIDWFEKVAAASDDRQAGYIGGGTALVTLTAGALHDVTIEYRYGKWACRGFERGLKPRIMKYQCPKSIE